MFQSTMERMRAALGPDHPHTLTAAEQPGRGPPRRGSHPQAIELLEPAVTLSEATLGPEHPDTINRRNGLATAYLAAGRADDSLRIRAATIKILDSTLGPDHIETLTGRNQLASAYFAAGRTADAIEVWEVMLPTTRRVLGLRHREHAGSHQLARHGLRVTRAPGPTPSDFGVRFSADGARPTVPTKRSSPPT